MPAASTCTPVAAASASASVSMPPSDNNADGEYASISVDQAEKTKREDGQEKGPEGHSSPPRIETRDLEKQRVGEDTRVIPPPPLSVPTPKTWSEGANGASPVRTLPRTRSLVLERSGTVLQAVPTSHKEVVEVMAEQSVLLTKLTVQLLWALRVSYKWIFMTIRLLWFVVLLLPAFLYMLYYWLFDKHVHKNIIYGLQGRNLLDVYTVPSEADAKDKKKSALKTTDKATPNGKTSPARADRPVVVFVSGGAWVIGYKGWGALLGRVLSSFGIVVVTPDYRNFPQGLVPDMVDDVTMSLQWVFDNIHHFGGDPNNVTLVGQSAGAHLAICTVLEQVERRRQAMEFPSSDHPRPRSVASPTLSRSSACSPSSTTSSALETLLPPATWELKQIRSVIGISGPYNMETALATFHKHGFDRSLVERIMAHDLVRSSPTLQLQAYAEHEHAERLFRDFPPVWLLHGTADKTVGWESTAQLAKVMRQCGLQVSTQYFPGKTHTDPIIEDPICGDDFLVDVLLDVVKSRTPSSSSSNSSSNNNSDEDNNAQDAEANADGNEEAPWVVHASRPSYPGILVRMARVVNPF